MIYDMLNAFERRGLPEAVLDPIRDWLYGPVPDLMKLKAWTELIARSAEA